MGRLSGEDGGRTVLRMRRRDILLLKSLPERLRPRLQSEDLLDPVAARLFPRSCDDPVVEKDFREMVSAEIRAAKLAALDAFEASLQVVSDGHRSQRITLEARQVDFWIAFLNDMRLLLGVALGIESDDWEEKLDFSKAIPDDLLIYLFLTHLQGELIERVLGGDPPAVEDGGGKC